MCVFSFIIPSSVCVGMREREREYVCGGHYTEDENKESSGIKDPLYFHLPFPYKIHVGKYGFKGRGGKPFVKFIDFYIYTM